MAVDNEKNIVFSNLDSFESYIEVGVYQGKGIVDIANNFPTVKKLIGVDNYLAYIDEFNNYTNITSNLAAEASYKVTDAQSQLNKEKAIKLITKNNLTDRIELWDKSSLNAADVIANSSIDAIFLDSYTNRTHAYNDVVAWYKKVRLGGVLCGQEWNPIYTIVPVIQNALDAVNSTDAIKKINNFWYIVKDTE